MVNTIMTILKSNGQWNYSPFGQYRGIDYSKRIEFQQRDCPHAHILLWLDYNPKEDVGKHMSRTIAMIDALCTVGASRIERVYQQMHNHTFTCYKKYADGDVQVCQFGAPFWSMSRTRVLLPMPKDHGGRDRFRALYSDMHLGRGCTIRSTRCGRNTVSRTKRIT